METLLNWVMSKLTWLFKFMSHSNVSRQDKAWRDLCPSTSTSKVGTSWGSNPNIPDQKQCSNHYAIQLLESRSLHKWHTKMMHCPTAVWHNPKIIPRAEYGLQVQEWYYHQLPPLHGWHQAICGNRMRHWSTWYGSTVRILRCHLNWKDVGQMVVKKGKIVRTDEVELGTISRAHSRYTD